MVVERYQKSKDKLMKNVLKGVNHERSSTIKISHKRCVLSIVLPETQELEDSINREARAWTVKTLVL